MSIAIHTLLTTLSLLTVLPTASALTALPTASAQKSTDLSIATPTHEQAIAPAEAAVAIRSTAVSAIVIAPESINTIQFAQRSGSQPRAVLPVSIAASHLPAAVTAFESTEFMSSVEQGADPSEAAAQDSAAKNESNVTPAPEQAPAIESAEHSSQAVSQTSQNASEPQPSSTESEDELFERIFGSPRNVTAQQLNVPFFVDDQLQGQILVLTATAATPIARLQATFLLEKLQDTVRPDILQELTASVDSAGNLSLSALQQAGLVATFDERRLEVRVQVPPALRRTTVNTLGNLPPEAADALLPSQVSGYLNIQGAAGVVWSDGAESAERRSLNLNIDGVLNVDDWVLEGSANLSEGAAWTRGDVRLVRDNPVQAIRYTIGDQIVPTRGYQSSIPMLGFSAVRNFSLQPYGITRPISRFEFFLERPSTVDVFISDRFTQTLRLPAGSQDIRNLPLNAGINEVQLVITDDLGRVQRLNFSGAVAADQLAPGVQQFAYGVGFRASTENGSQSYDWNQPMLTLADRWGLSENLTLGGYFQATLDRQVAGVEGVWSTSIGNFSWDVALSHDQELGVDGAAQVVYEVLQLGNNNPTQRSLRLALEYRGDNFMPLDDLTARDPSTLDFSANYTQQIFGNINARLNGRYQLGRDGSADAYSLGLGLSRAFNHGISVNVNLSQQHTQGGGDEQRAFLSLSWLFPRQRQSLITTAEINSSGASTQTTWNFDAARTVDRLTGSVSLNTNPELSRLTGKLNYMGYRASLGFSQELQIASDDNALIGNASQLTFGTALVFADGHFGWSRPVSNSFALVVRQGNLRQQVVEVNPTGNGYIARADALGPAVVPDLQPYYLSPLRIETPEMPIGYDIGAQLYHLLPTYRSGTVVYVGTDATVFLRGTVLTKNGEPIALQTGEVVSLSDPDWQPITIFTNRAGRFALTGFKPGQYELRFDDQRVVQFEIPAGQEGIYDVGTLQI